ncbi:hypothetical protein ACKWTF_006940 [Chironomus riparius]
MRNCRICLKTDILDDMIVCFENTDLIQDLYFLSNVATVEIEGDVAKICRRCVKNIKQAAEFKRLCIKSDTERKKISNERFLWFTELQNLKITDSIDVTEAVSVSNEKNTENDNNSEDPELEDLLLEGNDILAELEKYEKNLNELHLHDPASISNENRTTVNDFIEYLTYEQLNQVTNDILELLNINDFVNGYTLIA